MKTLHHQDYHKEPNSVTMATLSHNHILSLELFAHPSLSILHTVFMAPSLASPNTISMATQKI